MKEEILNLLKENNDSFISGQFISEKLGVTRTAIWKYINTLKNEGYKIESVSKKGYRLISSPDILTYEEIKENLNTKYIGRNIIYYDSIDSTNTKAKELASKGELNGTVIISEEQTSGRGRLGKIWCSPKNKGIWLSIILKPEIDPMNVAKITQIAGASVCKSLLEIGINSYIKWPNDIVINNKKVCGILTEMSCELNMINYVILGIGINANIDKNEIPEEISTIATSLKIEDGKSIKRKYLTAKILNNFEMLYEEFLHKNSFNTSLEICKKHSILLGKDIKIINRNTTIIGKAIDIDHDGRLVIEHLDGKKEALVSGEVSIRGLYGYV
ncbi:BirA family biotin operon repressor/biotin-[acetyl-CoA-carboxylase] ligase [Clostridium tetanomorphum]|uniref:Bifunctional ligase/repressor BirA n=1 Tax=Clostridium tetanomorphum TaxID=1553 RepID=A0A923E7W8_CLOTT|nr:biotin--[acetyl-CoA-carboxylase] ligase [Clostridium tetanomorphum]KAJ53901.1 birA bifunctional protein [Clostridium tetanomorphum DSM 665]MBC2398115.1 biotin--[acetyl-CoA-carboxylase] ligase [Clostridium tetanomorphum]MBP1864684.1 BirA family biotin operon repressor/biotin-[acetyl-CoA-carboxylase] ligase [Clostridium tetanomorphum]NRS84154.1 BirA family biotin operon repressor/biotin-[acetyl-CoA-carboxylase] ligase [Clostridium tetanomorphum]NRZ97367.1 BirA family biotin operon repressor/b